MIEKNISTPKSPYLKQILASFILGLPVAYLLASYFSNLFSGTFSFILLSLLFQLLCGTIIFLFLGNGPENIRKYLLNHWTTILALMVVLGLCISAIVISMQFPGLFDSRVMFMDITMLPSFAGLAVISIFAMILLVNLLTARNIIQRFRGTSLFQFMQTNLAGILLSLLFFLTYFVLAQSLNFPGHRTLDQYFDTDISDWIKRLTSHPGDEIPMVRAVHPAVMLILRPAAWVFSILLNGNKLQGLFLLIALTGASCVFLIWLIIKGMTGNTTYALVTASILGAGTSHLLLSSMLETYIFSAFALILFAFLMQSDRTSLKYTIPAGILIFGITISNMAQACILYFLNRPKIKTIVLFVLAVVAVTLVLNVIQVRIFPNAEPTYKPSSMTVEENYTFDLSESRWKSMGRVNLISRAIMLYGVVAPQPYILSEELGVNVPNFRTFQISIKDFKVAGYKGLGDVTAKFWAIILVLAFIQFAVRFVKSPGQMVFPLSLLLCLGFSFALHLVYGDDPMLYSPNWVYALVLFVAVSLEKWANNKWLQLTLIVFLGTIIYINLGLVHQIMEISLPFYGK